jgi:hypothetical protein
MKKVPAKKVAKRPPEKAAKKADLRSESGKPGTQLFQSAHSLERSWQLYRPRKWGKFINGLESSGIPYLSHSKLTCIERCPRCYYNEHILHIKQESDALNRGTLFHQTAEAFYASLQDGQRTKPAISANQVREMSLSAEDTLKLRNALTLMQKNQWEKHDILAVEECFFMDLAPGLPPIIGVPDLVLSRNGSLLIVDHKTSKSFNDLDASQLILYAEFHRRQRSINSILGVFDEYRLATDLTKIKKPAFRRTPVSVDRCFLPKLIARYRKAWRKIVSIQKSGEPKSSPDCWICNQGAYSSW